MGPMGRMRLMGRLTYGTVSDTTYCGKTSCYPCVPEVPSVPFVPRTPLRGSLGKMQGFIAPHGQYRQLISYQKTEVIYDITVRFCSRFLERRDRTVDQMVQAARSGKQNIAEGSQASGTSSEVEIKLTNVARASLEELRVDYEDYLRVHDLRIWPKESEEARFVRKLSRTSTSYEAYRGYCETRSAEVVANIALCLIHQANYLLDRQIHRLEIDFLKNGGVRERMTQARLAVRNETYGTNGTNGMNGKRR